MIRSILAPSLLLAVLILSGRTAAQCEDENPGNAVLGIMPIPYNLGAPDTVLTLDRRLQEISGLAWLDDNQIAAINDEDGDLFVIDSRSGSILEKKRFGDNGDYEGIARVGEAVFVLRSDGRLYHIPFWRSEEIDAARVKTNLSKSCDAEGLAFEEAAQALLIACKEFSGEGRKGMKSIYAFSLSSGTLHAQPRLVIDALDTRLTPREGKVSRSVRELLRMPRFKPSGIAIHPVSGDIYVLSSKSYSVAAFSRDGQLAHRAFLDPNIFPQAEGITFSPDGTLYIATEGSSKDGRLASFTYLSGADLSPTTGEDPD
ncbi:MAG: SdiA-regulated domain-containing protein [Rhodothermia bacterium]|nr:SdiA-regulated domain-containing protein [Rhodothermia bacterium]